jgi:hypothetical protein
MAKKIGRPKVRRINIVFLVHEGNKKYSEVKLSSITLPEYRRLVARTMLKLHQIGLLLIKKKDPELRKGKRGPK